MPVAAAIAQQWDGGLGRLAAARLRRQDSSLDRRNLPRELEEKQWIYKRDAPQG